MLDFIAQSAPAPLETSSKSKRGSKRVKPPPPPASEGTLELTTLQKMITKLKVMETHLGFYVLMNLNKSETWHFTTRRNRHVPKLFKDLNRLNLHLRKMCSGCSFELFRDQKFPPSQLPEVNSVYRITREKVSNSAKKVSRR